MTPEEFGHAIGRDPNLAGYETFDHVINTQYSF